MTLAKKVAADIKMMWNNGTRMLLIAFIFLVAAAVFFAAISILAFVALKPVTFNPIKDVNPQHVDNPGKTVTQGGVLSVTATKCNQTDEAINVTAESWFQSIDDRTMRIKRTDPHSSIRAPGCETTTFPNRIPADLPPGRWQIQASEVTRSIHDQVQSTGWLTEVFTVLPAEVP